MAPAFQSHAGSIEASPLHPKCSPLCWSFNPTLVRLRPCSTRSPTGPTSGFQSHAGSIEAAVDLFERFDSLAVSIPRWFD